MSTDGRGRFSALRTPAYRRWFVGQGISMAGFWAQIVGQALLVLELTDDGLLVGVAASLQFLPVLVVGPWAGVLCDRLNKRQLLLTTQTLVMGAAFTLGVLVLVDRVNIWAVLGLAAITGTANAFDQPARRTIVTDLVDEKDEANAVALSGAIANCAKLAGPGMAAATIAYVGIGWCFMLNAATSAAVLWALRGIDPRLTAPVPRPRSNRDILDGFRYVWSNPHIRLPMMMLLPVGAVTFNWNVVLPLLSTREFAGSAGTLAVLTGVMSAGSLVGILWLAGRPAPDTAFMARSLILLGLSTFLVVAAPNVATATIACAIVGAYMVIVVNSAVLVIQLPATPEVRGRVMAMFSMVLLGSVAFGSPVSGWIAEAHGTRIAISTGGATAIAVGFAGLSLAASSGDAPRLAAVGATDAPAPSGVPD